MACQALDVHRSSVKPCEGSHEPKEPKQAQDAQGTNRRHKGERVDPMAANVLTSIVRGEKAAHELDDEHGRQTRFGEFEVRSNTTADFVNEKPNRHPDEGEGAHREFPRNLMSLDEEIESVASSHVASSSIWTVDDRSDTPYGYET